MLLCRLRQFFERSQYTAYTLADTAELMGRDSKLLTASPGACRQEHVAQHAAAAVLCGQLGSQQPLTPGGRQACGLWLAACMRATIMTEQLPAPPTPACQLVAHRILNEQRQEVHLRVLACSQEHDNTVMAARDETVTAHC